MWRSLITRVAFLAATSSLVLSSSQVARGENWFDTILPEKSHDFGTVARGSKVRHTFRIVNTTNHDVHIADWRTKCGCTDVKVGAREVPPGTQTTVEVTLDTTRFQGYKASGLTVVFDRPQYAQVDLNITSFIRGDVMTTPGGVDFQVVPRGQGASQTLTLQYLGGRSDWAVTNLTTISEHVQAELREVSRQPGSLQYQLTAKLLPTAPAGHLRDEITLATNDPETPAIPISVSGQVQATLTVAPGILNLGRLRPGQTVTKQVLVRSGKAFKITGASCPKPDIKASATLGESKPFHAVTVTFVAPPEAGPYNATLDISTDLEGEPPARMTTFATIVP